MRDLRGRLDERAGRFTPSPDAFERVLARGDLRRRRRRIASATAALGISVAVAAVFAYSLRADRNDQPVIEPDPTPDASVHVPQHIGQLVSVDGRLWALGSDTRRPNDHYVLELDSRSGEIVRSFRVPGAVFVTGGGGSLWVTTYQKGRVVEIDTESGRIVRTVRLGHLVVVPYIAWDDGRVFVIVNDSIARIDPGFDRAVPIANVMSPAGIVVAAGDVWVADAGTGSVLRLDAETGEALATVDGASGSESAGIGVGGGTVWAASPTGLLRIDPATNRVVEFEQGGIYPQAFAASEGAVWLADTEEVWRIDASSGEIVSVGVGDHPVGVAVVGSTLWISNAVDTVVAVPTCTPTCPDQ